MSADSIIKKRRQRRLILIVAAVSGSVLGGMAASTAAWLTTADAITNIVNGSSMNAALEEPMWLTEGMEKAQAYLPGTDIKKDPQVLNTGSADLYVRMKIKIVDKDGAEVEYTSERAENILNSLYYKKEDNSYAPLIEAVAKEAPTEEEVKAGTYKVTYSKLATVPPERGCNINDKIYYSANPNFYLASDGYFYYIKTGDIEKSLPEFEVLDHLDGDTVQKTPPLFDMVKIPHRQSDYVSSFDNDYELDVTGEAVTTAALTAQEKNWANIQAAYN